jgi:C4-dicarboxylate-specific signal transduction histidine kinase
LKRRIEALILLAKRIYFLIDWLSSLRSVVSFLINWSAAELTNSSERRLAFVTEEQRDELTNSNERESAFITKKERQEVL